MKFTYKKTDKAVPIAVHLIPNKKRTKRKIIYYVDEESEDTFDNLTITEGKLFPIPYKPKGPFRTCTVITGSSGTGKSTFLRKLLEEQLKIDDSTNQNALFTSAEINTKDDADPAFKGLKDFGVVDLEWAMNNLTLHDCKNTNIIFDDVGYSGNKGMDKFLLNLMNSLLQKSRKLNCNLFIANHDCRNFHKTKLLQLEAQSFVLFPRSNTQSTKKMLKYVLDLNPKQMQEMINKSDKGRFSYMYINRLPPYVIMDKCIYFY